MPHPRIYQAQYDFSQDEQFGRPVDGSKLSAELANVAYSINRTIEQLKKVVTADGKWQPASALQMDLVEAEETIAAVGQTTFDLPNGATADTANDHARVYVNGVQLPPSQVGLNPTTVVLPAQVGGETVVVELYQRGSGVLAQLDSAAAGLGASLVAIEDRLGIYAAANVEDALMEVRALLNTTISNLGDLVGLIRRDGSVGFAANQSMGGFRIRDAADGVDPNDYVTLQQLQQLSSIFADLSAVYLRVDGANAMTGPLNMGNFRAINVAEPTGGTDAATKNYVDGAVAGASGDGDLKKDGTVPMEAPFDNGNFPSRNAADATNPTDLVTLRQLEAATSGENVGMPLGGCGVDGSSQLPMGAGGVFHYEGDVSIVGADITVAAGKDLTILCTGNLTISANIIFEAHLEAVGCPLNVGNLKIEAAGTLTITGAITSVRDDLAGHISGFITAHYSDILGTGNPLTDMGDYQVSSPYPWVRNTRRIELRSGGEMLIGGVITASKIGNNSSDRNQYITGYVNDLTLEIDMQGSGDDLKLNADILAPIIHIKSANTITQQAATTVRAMGYNGGGSHDEYNATGTFLSGVGPRPGAYPPNGGRWGSGGGAGAVGRGDIGHGHLESGVGCYGGVGSGRFSASSPRVWAQKLLPGSGGGPSWTSQGSFANFDGFGGGAGGGVLTIEARGQLTANGEFTASGRPGQPTVNTSWGGAGAGGGGSLLAACLGGISGGLFSADGGTPVDVGLGRAGGGGGGGFVALVGTTVVGAATSALGGGGGGDGLAVIDQGYAPSQLECLLLTEGLFEVEDA